MKAFDRLVRLPTSRKQPRLPHKVGQLMCLVVRMCPRKVDRVATYRDVFVKFNNPVISRKKSMIMIIDILHSTAGLFVIEDIGIILHVFNIFVFAYSDLTDIF